MVAWNTGYSSLQEEFEDIKGVIRIHKSKNRQPNGQKKKDNDLQNIIHTTKDRVTQTHLNTGGWTQVLRKGYQIPALLMKKKL